ncbi:methionyl-tRNA formyltransferase [Spirochaetia bacterium]|nr:methionyl-tRNA formyltransferase [Spirochaetia bacterium]
MRILFAGSPAIAVPSLARAANRGELAGVLTNPDSVRGSKKQPEATDVGAAAVHFLPESALLKPEKLDAAARNAVEQMQPDLLVSFAYGKIFGPKFLSLFPLGGINIHPSLLPLYRGPTPIPAALLNRDSKTGITIQALGAEMDAGDIFLQERFPLSGKETTATLSEFVAQRAAELLPVVLDGINAGTMHGQKQNSADATYCHLISKEDGLIKWSKSAVEIEACVRAYTPWPLVYTWHQHHCLYILESGVYSGENSEMPGTVLGTDKDAGILVQTGQGILGITRLHYQYKKPLFWKDFQNGSRGFFGSQLGA